MCWCMQWGRPRAGKKPEGLPERECNEWTGGSGRGSDCKEAGMGSRKSEIGSRKWEVGSRKWEVGSGKSEVGSGKWEGGSGKVYPNASATSGRAEGGRGKAEGGSRKGEVGNRKSEIGSRKSEGCMPPGSITPFDNMTKKINFAFAPVSPALPLPRESGNPSMRIGRLFGA